MLQKSSIDKTIEIFYIDPEKEYYLMDISRKINLAHTSVKKNLARLIQLKLITESFEKKGKRKFPIYKTNINNYLFKKNKSIYNLNSILNSNLIKFLEEKLLPKSIILFGSYVRGEDTKDSDIDLFIECKQEELNLEKFENKLDRKIQLHFKDNFDNYPKELKNNIINGIVVHGFLEGYK